ncbi:MAG TPA: hypothetical protein VGY98_07305 [Verrucomicrobiae bacterium]|nr:hypothetical protein [Verrucomicrobiae bacterium]
MMYVLAIFIPPVYFLINRRWMAFAFTFAALICSIFLLAELFLAPLVVVLWFACAFFAVWDIQQRVLKEKPK